MSEEKEGTYLSKMLADDEENKCRLYRSSPCDAVIKSSRGRELKLRDAHQGQVRKTSHSKNNRRYR